MRLLQINTTLNSGSTGRIVENLGILAIQKGWECFVLHGSRYVNESRLNSKQIGGLWDERLHGLRTLLFDAHGLGSKHATLRILQYIDKINPDIIHLHNIHGYYINYPVLFDYLKRIDIPVVWTFHDCWNFTGHCVYFSMNKCDKWKYGCYECPIVNSYPRSFFDFSQRNFSLKKKYFTGLSNLTVVPVSDWLSSLVKESFFKDYRIERIYNGINTDVFYPRNNSLETKKKYHVENKFLILGVASPWSEHKGLTDFIHLSKRLSKDEIIILVGINKNQRKILPENIISIERTDNIDLLAELYSAADLFFNPSKQETFGLTTVEALACGTPALVYDVTACPEIVDSSSGYIVEVGDYDKILDIIVKVKNKGRKIFKIECRKRVLEHFKDNLCYDDYLKLYNKLLKK